MTKTLMAVFAHPDDESFATGGTLARYAREGVRTILVCATRGEAGKWGNVIPMPGQTLGEVREKELLAAAEILGISEVRFLNYLDKTLSQVPEAEVAAKISAIMEGSLPDVVITFGPDGVSGHPDHKAIHRMTEKAFRRYLNTKPEAFLYYICFPPDAPQLRGIAPRPWAVEPNMVIDVAAYWEEKKAAIYCHETQSFSRERIFAVGEEQIRKLFRNEYYLRAYPPGEPSGREDLFFST